MDCPDSMHTGLAGKAQETVEEHLAGRDIHRTAAHRCSRADSSEQVVDSVSKHTAASFWDKTQDHRKTPHCSILMTDFSVVFRVVDGSHVSLGAYSLRSGAALAPELALGAPKFHEVALSS